MTTTAVKTVGTSSRDYSVWQVWEDSAPTDLTLTRSATTVTGSTSSTIMLDALASSTTDFYVGHPVWANARSTEIRLITAYNGTTKVATIGAFNGSSATWANTPSAEAYTIDACIWQSQLYNDSAFSSTSNLLTVASSTSSSTAYKEATTGPGQSFMDHASVQTNALCFNASLGVSVLANAGYIEAITANESWSRINKIMIAGINSNQSSPISTSDNSTVNRCIIENLKTSTFIGGHCYNSLIICRGASSANIVTTNRPTAQSFINCDFVVPSDVAAATVGIHSQYATITVKNCAVYGATAPTGGGGSGVYNITTSYCDATATGWTTKAYDTSTGSGFQNITDATRDYRIKSTSGLIDVGTTDSTNAATDIVGTARPQGSAYDVGAWEYVSAAAAFIAKAYKYTTAAIRGSY